MLKRLLCLVLLVPIVVSAQEKKVEILRDSKGHKIGTVKTDNNGTQKIYDDKNHYRGQYRSSDNVTRDEKGHKIGTGNQNIRNLDK